MINFDVPASPDDYVHRVGRTARADATGDAFLFVAPEEEANLRAIERSIKKQLPRVVLPGFDYTRKTPEKLEVPLQQRLAAMRSARGSGRPRRPEGHGRPSGPRPAARVPRGHPRLEPAPGPGVRRAPPAQRSLAQRLDGWTASWYRHSLFRCRCFGVFRRGGPQWPAFASQGRASTSHTRLGRRRPTSK